MQKHLEMFILVMKITNLIDKLLTDARGDPAEVLFCWADACSHMPGTAVCLSVSALLVRLLLDHTWQRWGLHSKNVYITLTEGWGGKKSE